MSRHTTDRLISRVLYASITDIYCGIKIIESSACSSAGTRGQANQPQINRSIDLWCLTELPDNSLQKMHLRTTEKRGLLLLAIDFGIQCSNHCLLWSLFDVAVVREVAKSLFEEVYHISLCGFIECNWREK